LSLTAAIGVSIDPLPSPPNPLSGQLAFPAETITFLASGAVGIHISICWVVSVDFEGSWQFSQAVHTPAITVDVSEAHMLDNLELNLMAFPHSSPSPP